jgi:hypothetical protein
LVFSSIFRFDAICSSQCFLRTRLSGALSYITGNKESDGHDGDEGPEEAVEIDPPNPANVANAANEDLGSILRKIHFGRKKFWAYFYPKNFGTVPAKKQQI